MKVKKVNRYYCDFCRKGLCSKYWMERHESSCTANPKRECRMCQAFERADLPKDDCPVCKLAVLRQSRDYEERDFDDRPWFNFKDEMEAAWKKINEARVKNGWE